MEHEGSQRTQKTLYPLYINPYELCYMLAYHVQDAFSPLFCRHHYGCVDKHGYLYADKPPLENQYSYGWLWLVLNRYVPNTSSLMSRIEFVGNALFIPYFLIGVGMMINVKVIANLATIYVALNMIVVAIVSKWLMNVDV